MKTHVLFYSRQNLSAIFLSHSLKGTAPRPGREGRPWQTLLWPHSRTAGCEGGMWGTRRGPPSCTPALWRPQAQGQDTTSTASWGERQGSCLTPSLPTSQVQEGHPLFCGQDSCGRAWQVVQTRHTTHWEVGLEGAVGPTGCQQAPAAPLNSQLLHLHGQSFLGGPGTSALMGLRKSCGAGRHLTVPCKLAIQTGSVIFPLMPY